MLGERSDQRGLWEADRLYLDHVGRGTFCGLLASLRGRLFRDAEFAEFYCADNGRDSVPPSLLATALLLQSHDKVSDAEAKARADFDIRWKVALGIEVEDRPFAKSTLQVFRAQLILHDRVRERIRVQPAPRPGVGVPEEAQHAGGAGHHQHPGPGGGQGHLQSAGRRYRQADAGAGCSGEDRPAVEEWAKARGYERYLGSSVKGEAAIDWSDKRDRTALLSLIVADADRLLE